MQSNSPRFPAPVHHKASEQDVLFLRDESGKRRMVYLGKHFPRGRPPISRSPRRASRRQASASIDSLCDPSATGRSRSKTAAPKPSCAFSLPQGR